MKRIALLIFLFLSHTLWAATIQWTGAHNTAWEDGANWSGLAVPGPYDIVEFTSGLNGNCNINSNVIISGFRIDDGYVGTVSVGNFNLFVGYYGILIKSTGTLTLSTGTTKIWGEITILTLFVDAPQHTLYGLFTGAGDFIQYPSERFENYLPAPPLENLNYITSTSVYVPIASESQIPALEKGEVIIDRTYFNSYGQPLQRVTREGTPDGKKDLVTLHQYNDAGFETKLFLPYAQDDFSGAFKSMDQAKASNAFNDQANFYKRTDPNTPVDPSIPYAGSTGVSYNEILLQNAPEPEILKQGFAGQNWQLSGTHVQQVNHRTNTTTDNVLLWTYNDIGLYASAKDASSALVYWPAGTLNVTENTDEDGHLITKYTDIDGMVILARSAGSSTTDILNTYYVYDNLDQLVLVLSPKASDLYVSGSTVTISNNNSVGSSTNDLFAQSYCYTYFYDERGRLIRKQKPDCGLELFVYNDFDQLILSQNAVQSPAWIFHKYDGLGREAINGTYPNTTNQSQSTLNNLINNTTTYAPYEEAVVGGGMVGYTNVAFPTTAEADIQNANYFSRQEMGGSVINYAYNDTGFESTPLSRTQGLMTGTRIRNPGSDNWLFKALFYDKYDHLIQQRSNNHIYASATANVLPDLVNNVYDFDGTLTQAMSRKVLPTGDNPMVTLEQRFTYNTNKQPVQHFVKAYLSSSSSTATEVLASFAEYNDLGQLIRKSLHSENGRDLYLQNIDYRYNTRGWLTSINNASLTADGTLNEDNNDLFGMELGYDQVISNNTALYNGNISALKWKANNTQNPNEDAASRAYNFSYDLSNRLTTSQGNVLQANAWNSNSAFNEQFSYDKNGNILSLQRNNKLAGQIDNIGYTYKMSGNSDKIDKLTDSAPNTGGFTDKGAAGDVLDYDAIGNLIAYPDLAATLNYNTFHNLVSEVDFTQGNVGSVNYYYTGDARKVKKATQNSMQDIKTVNYIDEFIFEDSSSLNNTLLYILIPEGRINFNPLLQSFDYQYAITDHLGNVRVEFDKDHTTGLANVIQENHYYPSGLIWADASLRTNTNRNPYLYNGKELQDETQFYDYGARMYDPVVGRFWTIDPLAEKYSFQTPYAYAVNNPTRYRDVMGMGVDDDKETPSNVSAAANGSLSFGIQGGFSFKFAGENFSFFINVGSIPLASFENTNISGPGKGVTVNEGIDIGVGPVGVSGSKSTNRGSQNGVFTETVTTKQGGNLFNVESSTTTTETNNKNGKLDKETKSTSSIGVTQSAKGGLFLVGEVSVGTSYDSNSSASKTKKDPTTAPSDATNVSKRLPPLIVPLVPEKKEILNPK